MNNNDLAAIQKMFYHNFANLDTNNQKMIMITLFRLANNDLKQTLFQQNSYNYQVQVINQHNNKLINILGDFSNVNDAILVTNKFNSNSQSKDYLAQIAIK